MAKIHLLSELTINQIAAGEVIEAPFSVVKELVENSLDAGATTIVVELTGGGLQKIVISDNGSGMEKEDALLCLERHATSKIRESSDLAAIHTMGFRGEALASIASIAKMIIRTAQDGEVGTEVEVVGGVVENTQPCARTKGTTIEVKQLFYNVPARRKFQKAPGSCAAEVTKTLVALSLANPHISFTLYQQEEKVLDLVTEEGKDSLLLLEKRVEEVLGKEFIEGSTKVDIEGKGWRCYGVIGSVQNTRPNRTLQYQFVNGRFVSCPAISFAVRDALGTRIEEGRYPIYVLHLYIDADCIDVNVHPQKREIRILEEKGIKQELQRKLQDVLFLTESPVSSFEAPLSFVLFPEFDRPQLEEEKKEEPVEPVPVWTQDSFIPVKRAFPIGLYGSFLWLDASSLSWGGAPSSGIVLVNLQAASASVLFAECKNPQKSSSQELLFPVTVPYSIIDEMEVENSLQQLHRLGFSVQRGRQSIVVSGIPSSFPEEQTEEFLRDFLTMENKEEEMEIQSQRKLASLCSKVASSNVKGHTMITALSLIEAWEKIGCPSFCPVGKKVWTPLQEKDLLCLLGGKK